MTSLPGDDPRRSSEQDHQSAPSRDSAVPAASRDRREPAESLLERACRAVVESTRCQGAAVTVMSASGARELMFASNALAQYLDDIQFTTGLGPCLEAFSTGSPVVCTDLRLVASEQRWLDFTSDALAAGAASVFAFPLMGATTAFGVLELYRTSAGDLDADDRRAMERGAEAVGSLVLAHFAASQAAARGDDITEFVQDRSNPRNAWTEHARSHVNFAVGMVSVQLEVNTDDALASMRSLAYLEHRSLSDVADDVVNRRIDFRDRGAVCPTDTGRDLSTGREKNERHPEDDERDGHQ